MSRFLMQLLISFTAISLSACALNPMQLVANNALERLSFITQENANQGSTTAIDVVFIQDAKAIDNIPKTSWAWFHQKSSLLRRHHVGVLSIEMAPRTVLKDIKLPNDHADAVAIIVYVNMLIEQPLIRIPVTEKCMQITVAEQGVKYKTCT